MSPKSHMGQGSIAPEQVEWAASTSEPRAAVNGNGARADTAQGGVDMPKVPAPPDSAESSPR